MGLDMTEIIFVGLALTVFVGLPIQASFLWTLHRTLQRCAPENRTLSPGLVWLSLIPLFGYFWQFVIVSRIDDSLRREFISRSKGMPMPQQNYGYGIGITMCILPIGTIIPIIGIAFGLAALVCWIVYWAKIAGYSDALAAGKELEPGQAGEPQFEAAVDPARGWLVLLVLMFAFGSSFVYRVALSSMIPLIRVNMDLSYSRIGYFPFPYRRRAP